MPKLILLSFFFLLAITPTFALIEFRDTTPMPSCDTIIYKRGMVAIVKVLSLTNKYVTYKPCDDNVNQSFTVKRIFIRSIKSKELPKVTVSDEAILYEKEAKKTQKTITGLLWATLLSIVLGFLFRWRSFRAILFLLAFTCLLFLFVALIHLTYISVKSKKS